MIVFVETSPWRFANLVAKPLVCIAVLASVHDMVNRLLLQEEGVAQMQFTNSGVWSATVVHVAFPCNNVDIITCHSAHAPGLRPRIQTTSPGIVFASKRGSLVAHCCHDGC